MKILKRDKAYIIFILSLVIFFSCSKDKAVSDGKIDVETIFDNSVVKSLSDMGYSHEIIPLETKDSCLLPGNSHVVHVDKENVFISAGALIYRFGIDGSFKNTIGKVGSGPMEHKNIHSVSFNDREGKVFIYDGNKKMIVWDKNGNPIDEVTLEIGGHLPCIFNLENEFIGIGQTYDEKAGGTSILRFDGSGICMDRRIVSKAGCQASPSYFTMPLLRENVAGFCYYNPYNSNFQNISKEKIEDFFFLDFGKYAQDNEKMQDMDYRSANADGIVELWDFIVCDDICFLLFRRGKDLFAASVNLIDGGILFSSSIENPRKGGGIPLFDEEYGITIWPHYEKEGVLFSLCDIGGLSDKELNQWSTRTEGEQGISDNSNPCLVKLRREK